MECEGFNGTLTLSENLSIIEDNVFCLCKNFTGSLILPQNITSIGELAFFCCENLSGNLIIPDKVSTIGYEAFFGCKSFTGSLIIGQSVEEIVEDAFGCTDGFSYLYLPPSIKKIGYKAFDGIKCEKIECEAIIPPTLKCGQYYWDSFSNYAKNYTKLYVPAESLSLYKTAAEWKDFKYINPIGAEVSGITLDKSSASITIGESVALTATIEPENAVDKSIIWTSSDESIATVVEGVVTGVKVGTVTITATTSNDLTATCEITVNPIVASDVTLNVADMTLLIGQSEKLTATVLPENTTDATITWASDNEAVATVAADGTVTAVSVGVANITATCGNVSATCKVTVNPVVASGVTLNVEDLTLLVGQSDKLTATVEPSNTTNATITWASDNEAVATVATDGTVTAVSVGVTNITATCGNVSATCKVTVNPVVASGVTLNVENLTLLIGQTDKLTATVLPENTTDKTVTWKSDNEAIAKVSEDGTVTAVAVGVANITASCGDVKATCKVTVTPVSPTSIDLNIKDMVLFIGQSETIQAVIRPANTTYPTVTWHSENESIATVSANGKVTGIAEGVATITAKCGNVSATCVVTVNPIPASNIEITSGNVTLTIGSSAKLAAKVSPENTTHPEVEWSSSDIGIATITADGIVTAVSLGTVVITAKCGNVSTTCTVTVIPVPSEGIVISPSSVSMLLGDKTTLTASVFPENTTDKTVTWGSDNPAVASVTSDGVVTALGLGTATITASNGLSKATCRVTVNPVVATSISLNVKDETIFVASTTQLAASFSPENVTDKTITWTSSKPEIATVSDQGLVYGVAVGTTTITASIGSVSTTCQINVVHRIPDMDPAVSTSERDIFTLSGQPVNMAVYATGGEPTSWSYVWTKNGEVVSKSDELNITAVNNSETIIADTYRVKVENEIDKVVIFSEIFDFVVRIYPAVETPANDNDIIISTGDNGSNKTREGNKVTLSVMTPKGGNPQGWEYVWSGPRGEIGEGETIETVASMSSGNSMAIEQTAYTLKMTDYSPEGEVWAQFNLVNTLDVYRRPETPSQMLRKGNGSSHTFIAMMPVPDEQLGKLGYTLVYGWTDSDGNDHTIEQTSLRYCHTDGETYNKPTNKFWVYSVWNYQDGSVVSSGRRYLDGSLDEDFDASVFDGSGVMKDGQTGTRSAIYTINGHYLGTDLSKLSPGIYIYTTETEGVKNTEKIIIK